MGKCGFANDQNKNILKDSDQGVEEAPGKKCEPMYGHGVGHIPDQGLRTLVRVDLSDGDTLLDG